MIDRYVCVRVAGVVLMVSLAAAAFAGTPEENWGQWRGPLGTGVAPIGDPPTTWGEGKNVKWKVQIPGSGTATPIVWDKFVFIETAVPTGKKLDAAAAAALPPEPPPLPGRGGKGNGPKSRKGGGAFGRGQRPTEVYQFVILCLDRQTGKVLWQQAPREEVPHQGHHPSEGNFSPCSPVTDGQHVYAYFGSRGLHCYDMAGNLKWQKDFGRMQTKMSFGEGSSPALHGDTIVVNWDQEGGSFIVALDKNSGKELWRQPRDEETTWATPLVVEYNGQAQVVTSGTNKIRSYDLNTGRQVWESDGLTMNVIPSPVAAGDIVYAMSGFNGHKVVAIRLGRTGNLEGTDAIVWSLGKATPYVPSPLLYNDRLYFLADNNAVLSCVDARTGKVLIDAKRIEGMRGVFASPVGAGGRIYVVGKDGTAVVLKQSDTLEVLATNRLEDKFDASPAVVGKELFLRGHEYLYCLAGE